jgi:GMP synthase (glutamine-hydrolysing)
MNLFILKTGGTFADLAARRGDFEDWFAAHLHAHYPGLMLRVLHAQQHPELPPPAACDGLLITGSDKTVHEHEPWSVRAGEWLAAVVAAGVPVLGVCYGHQLLADALGGITGRNPRGREIGVVEIEVSTGDPLFDGLPPRFPVFATHCDAVLTLPQDGRVLAGNSHTAVQALAIGPHARGVQFHPEFDADVMRHYLQTRAPLIDGESGEGTAARLLAEVREVPAGPVVLRNFLRLCI